MSYRNRLRENIKLTSPDGNVFEAFWIGSERSQEKKLGIHNFPNVNGSSVQDLGVAGAIYPITLSFEGPDNDIISARFFNALKEKGTWEVIHPVHGLLNLQPVSFSPNDQPVTSGNITQVNTEWIEIVSLDAPPSAPELQATTAAQIVTINDVTSDQLVNSTFQDTAEEKGSFRKAVLDVVAGVEKHLETLSKFSSEITAEMESIKRDIDVVLAVIPLDIIAVAGQLQQLIQLPALAVEDTSSRLDAYGNFASDISLSLTPDAVGTSNYNRVAIQELALTSAMAAVADISTTGDILSRPEAVGIIDTNIELFESSTNALDATQELFKNEPIDTQYFSQSQSYPQASRLVGLTVEYLLRAAFDLKVEKRFILDRQRNPVMVALEEYGSPGENDANINLFIDTNKLEDIEHLIMQAGRELVVYV
jgi:prophage DNA circulation protein